MVRKAGADERCTKCRLEIHRGSDVLEEDEQPYHPGCFPSDDDDKPHPEMRNRRMAEKLKKKDCIDVSPYEQKDNPGIYELPSEWEKMIRDAGKDFCDMKREAWIWSIGLASGKIYASLDGRFYGNKHYECIWLR